MVDSGRPDKGGEVFEGGLTLQYLDENDSEKSADSDVGHILLKWGGYYKVL